MADKPTDRQRKALLGIQAAEAKGSGVVNREDAEECVDKDWAEPTSGGAYRLTDAGRRVLKISN